MYAAVSREIFRLLFLMLIRVTGWALLRCYCGKVDGTGKVQISSIDSRVYCILRCYLNQSALGVAILTNST